MQHPTGSAKSTCPDTNRPPERVIRDFLVAAAMHQYETVAFFVDIIGLHPDSTYGGKPTALCYSVIKPEHCMMEYLVGQGADVNRQDGMGMTPLHYATMGGCEVCLAYLISRGAHINAVNNCGKTPLSLLPGMSGPDDCREFLLRKGAGLKLGPPGLANLH